MAAYWRTQPVFERSGPQIYVHVEFGVSLGRREEPRHHEVTFRSRTLRDRFPSFPRHFPAPNTNFLTYPSHPQEFYAPQQQPHQQQRHQIAPQQHQYALHGLQEALPPPLGLPIPREPVPLGFIEEEEERQSRSDSRSSHGRGRSEPPPLNNNPWDVFGPSAPRQSVSTMTSTQAQAQTPHRWKDLPEVPSRYRLGENGLPWSSWSWPMGYDPSAYPQDERAPTSQMPQREEVPSSSTLQGSALVTSQSADDVKGQGPSTSPASFPPIDTSVQSTLPPNKRELSALSEAMATVDNGFEDQWWNQGPRLNLPADDVPPAMAANLSANRPPPQRFSPGSLGWAIASGQPERPADIRSERRSFAGADNLVSPISQGTASRYRLTRSLSTRSEEYWWTEGAENQQTSGPEHWSDGYYA
jgi:hypothetical protein